MTAPSEDDNALLISSEEIRLSPDYEVTEQDDGLIPNHSEPHTGQCHSSTNSTLTGRFRQLGGWARLLLKWWRTLVILLTPLILLLLFAIAEDTKVSD